MSTMNEIDVTEQPKPTIVVDVRGTQNHCGKSTVLRMLWKAMADAGLDPKSEMFTINCTDEDVTADQILHEGIDEMIAGGVELMRRQGTQIHFIDTNKRPISKPFKHSPTVYRCRYRVKGQPWSDWSECSLETYRAYVEEPMQGNTEFETSVVFQQSGGVNLEVSERFLAGLNRNILALNEWAELMSYEKSLIGEPAGLLKGKIRELVFMMNNLMRNTYVGDTELYKMLDAAKPENRDFFNEWASKKD